MLTGYIIIAGITTIIMLWLCKRAGIEESNYCDDPEGPAENKLSLAEILFSVGMGAAWPAVIVVVLVVAITGLN